MNKTEFTKQLRKTAEILKPLAQSASPGAKVWNGSSYVKNEVSEGKGPDPYALTWWTTLLTIASLLEAQDAPLSSKQLTYLESMLFRGMGSLNDLSFQNADEINRLLRQKRSDLFTSFND